MGAIHNFLDFETQPIRIRWFTSANCILHHSPSLVISEYVRIIPALGDMQSLSLPKPLSGTCNHFHCQKYRLLDMHVQLDQPPLVVVCPRAIFSSHEPDMHFTNRTRIKFVCHFAGLDAGSDWRVHSNYVHYGRCHNGKTSLNITYNWHSIDPVLSDAFAMELALIPTWISNHMHNKVWDEITDPFPNSNGSTVEVWEWMSDSIPRSIMDVITFPCGD